LRQSQSIEKDIDKEWGARVVVVEEAEVVEEVEVVAMDEEVEGGITMEGEDEKCLRANNKG
jgi:hypothetical protein